MTPPTNNVLFAWPIFSDPGALYTPTFSSPSGAWETNYPLTNLATRYLDGSAVARSVDATLARTRFKTDLKADRALRVIGIPKHTLSSAAYVRTLIAPASMLFDYEAGDDPSGIAGYSFTRATTATYVDRNGVVRTASSGVLRDSHFIGGVRHVLLEPARTNLCIRSEEFSNAAWTKTSSGGGSNPVVTADQTTAPDGATTADKVVFAAPVSGDQSFVTSTSFATAAASTYAGSFWVKAFDTGDVGKTILFRHVAGSAFTSVVLTASWQRVSAAEVAAGASATLDIGLRPAVGGSTGTVSCYLWGADVELGAYASSYIPTTSGSVTRNADVLSFSAVANGTYYEKYWDLATQAYVEAASVYSGAAIAPTTGRAYSIPARIATGTVSAANMLAMVYDSGWVASYPSGQTAETLQGLNVGFVQIVNGQTGFTGRYVSTQIDDAANSAGYVELARICICGGWQPDANAEYGATFGWQFTKEEQETDAASFIYNARKARRIVRFRMPSMSESDAFTYPWQMDRRLAGTGQFLFVWDPTDTTLMHERAFLAVMPEPSELDFAYFGRLNVPRLIREDL